MSDNNEKALPECPKNHTLMQSLRAFRFASLSGHVLYFESMTPIPVHNDAVEEAMAQGCVPCSLGDTSHAFNDNKPVAYDFQSDLRKSAIYLALQSIKRENNVKDFDASGLPKTSVVSERLGIDVTLKDVQLIWREAIQAENEGRDFGLHAQAQNVMRLVDATSSAEMLALADEFKMDVAKLKGMTQRQMRREMLSKFAGVVVR